MGRALNLKSEKVACVFASGFVFVLAMMFTSGCAFFEGQEVSLLGQRSMVPPPQKEAPAKQTPEEEEVQSQEEKAEAPKEEMKEEAVVPLDIAPKEIPSQKASSKSVAAKERATGEKTKERVQVPEKVETERLKYKVEKGDTLWEISRKYDVTVDALADFNDMEKDDTLRAGTELVIPPGGKKPEGEERTDTQEPSRSRTEDGKYRVQKGDNLWEIAQRFNTSVDELKNLNGLESETLRPGQVLVVPAEGQTSASRGQQEDASGTSSGSTSEEKSESGMFEKGASDSEQPESTGRSEVEASGTSESTDGDSSKSGTEEENKKKTGSSSRDDEGTNTAGKEEGGGQGELPALPKTLEHTVTAEDTLKSIALMYGTSVSAIKQANSDIENNDDLEVNSKLVIPIEE